MEFPLFGVGTMKTTNEAPDVAFAVEGGKKEGRKEGVRESERVFGKVLQGRKKNKGDHNNFKKS